MVGFSTSKKLDAAIDYRFKAFLKMLDVSAASG
jgi:hypothetical protein